MSISKQVIGEQPAVKQTPREEMHQAVDALIQRQRLRLHRDKSDKVEYHVIPSLWEQLVASTSWRGGGGAVGGSFGSRPVVSTGALALEAEINMFIENGIDKQVTNGSPYERYARACHEADAAWQQVELRKAEYDIVADYPVGDIHTDEDKAGYADLLAQCAADWEAATQRWAGLNDRAENKLRTLTPDNIRALAANLTDPLDYAWWRDVILDWCAQITEQLALNPVRPQYLGGMECPDCHARSFATKRRENGKTEKMKLPALAIVWASPDQDGTSYQPPEKFHIAEIKCQVCTQRWKRGPALDSLVDLTIRKRGLKDKLLQKLAGMEEIA